MFNRLSLTWHGGTHWDVTHPRPVYEISKGGRTKQRQVQIAGLSKETKIDKFLVGSSRFSNWVGVNSTVPAKHFRAGARPVLPLATAQ